MAKRLGAKLHNRTQEATTVVATEKEFERENKYRVQLDFSEPAFRELEKLQSKLNASSRAEVVRNALGVLRWLTDNLTAGNKVVIERKDGKRAETDFPFLLIDNK